MLLATKRNCHEFRNRFFSNEHANGFSEPKTNFLCFLLPSMTDFSAGDGKRWTPSGWNDVIRGPTCGGHVEVMRPMFGAIIVERTRTKLARLRCCPHLQTESLLCQRANRKRHPEEERRNDASHSSRAVGLDEPQTTRSSRTSRVWRFL